MSVGYDSLEGDGLSNEWVETRRSGVGGARTKKDEEDEEDRLLEAGGLLATKIQQALSEVLQYDCSIGVANNKVSIFLSRAGQSAREFVKHPRFRDYVVCFSVLSSKRGPRPSRSRISNVVCSVYYG